MFNPFRDEEDLPRYDEDGRLIYIPEGWAVEYLVAAEGYHGADFQRVSEVGFGWLGVSDKAILRALDLPEDTGFYLGYVQEVEYSIAETPIRRTDIPEAARFIRTD